MLTMLRIILAAALLCVVGPAFADTAATTTHIMVDSPMVLAASGTAWSPGWLYVQIQPFLLSAFGVIFSTLLGWLCLILQRKFNLSVSDSAKAELQQSAMNAAGRILASQDDNFAKMKIDVHSQVIADELPKVLTNAAGAIQTLGLTPDRVGALIQGKVGQLQAAAQSTAPVIAPVDAPKVQP